jgi:hypothetical protein
LNLIAAGRVVLLTVPQVAGSHLWFILTDPDPAFSDRVVAVMLVTPKPHTDKTITLLPGDHPFITHESNVDYGGATFVSSVRLSTAIRNGKGVIQADAPAKLLRTLRAGLLTSPRVVNEVAEYCRALQCFQDLKPLPTPISPPPVAPSSGESSTP